MPNKTDSMSPAPRRTRGETGNAEAAASGRGATTRRWRISGFQKALVAVVAVVGLADSSTPAQAVTLDTQTITWGSPVAGSQQSGTGFEVSATASSGLPVTFTSKDPAACKVSGTTVKPVKNVPTCTIIASQAGVVWDDGYNVGTGASGYDPAALVARSFTIAKTVNGCTMYDPPVQTNCSDAELPYIDFSTVFKSGPAGGRPEYLLDLTGAILKGVNLTGSNVAGSYSGANLTDAYLVGATLVNTSLVSANLTNANLRSADLTGVDLLSGKLLGANLTNANLTGARLTKATLTNANLTGANLTGAVLTNVISGGIVGNPAALPTGWTLSGGYLVEADTLPPVLIGTPADFTVEATSAAGAPVTWATPTALDAVDGPLDATCTPGANTVFAIDSTLVTCMASDAAGNAGSTSFTVTVEDTTAPALVTPADVTVEATSTAGATAAYGNGTALDAVGVLSGPSCPGSGDTFPIGTTPVTCTASDAAGNTGSASFNVTVEDTTRPSLTFGTVAAVSDGLYPLESFSTFPETVGSSSVTLSGTASDVVGVTSMTVNGVTAAYAGGTWSLAGISLVPGVNTLAVVASDQAGNTTHVSVDVTFTTDLDGDGIANNVDGSCAGVTGYKDLNNATFSDLQRGGLTCGAILRTGGHTVTVADSTDAAKGLRFIVEEGPGLSAKVQLAGKASSIYLAAGSISDVTDPESTTTVQVVNGQATIELEVTGVPVVIDIPEGASATITETANADGTIYSLEIEVEGGATFNGGAVPPDGVSFVAPANKDQCKDSGWKGFNFPRTFEDQGDCIQFVNTHKYEQRTVIAAR